MRSQEPVVGKYKCFCFTFSENTVRDKSVCPPPTPTKLSWGLLCRNVPLICWTEKSGGCTGPSVAWNRYKFGLPLQLGNKTCRFGQPTEAVSCCCPEIKPDRRVAVIKTHIKSADLRSGRFCVRVLLSLSGRRIHHRVDTKHNPQRPAVIIITLIYTSWCLTFCSWAKYQLKWRNF